MPTIRPPSLSVPATLRSPATLVPIAIIAVLAAALAIHQVITRWHDINPSRAWVAATAVDIPDEADAAVILNLAALRNTDRRNTINLWRVNAVQNGATDLTAWADTGHDIGDKELAAMNATRITWMSLSAQGGQAVKINASSDKVSDENSPAVTAEQWNKIVPPEGLALLEKPTSTSIVARQAADKSLAASRDYQQASRAIAEPNFIFAFAKWRSLPPETIPAIAHPLSCDTDKWIAAGIDVPFDNRVTVTVACPHLPGQWGSGPLRTTATSREGWDATIGATFANHWNALQTGPVAPAVSWIAAPIRTSHPEASMNIMPHLASDAWLTYHETPGGRKCASPCRSRMDRHNFSMTWKPSRAGPRSPTPPAPGTDW